MTDAVRQALAAEMGSYVHAWWSRYRDHDGDFKDCEECQRLGAEVVEKMSEKDIAILTAVTPEYSIGFTV